MIAYLLQVTICLGLFYAFYHVALRRETLHAANRLYLLSTLFAGMLIPLLEIRLVRPLAAPVVQSAIHAGARVGQWPEIAIQAARASTIDWVLLAMGAYTLISLLLLARMALGLVRIWRIRRAGQPVDIKGHRCILDDRVAMPFSFGHTIYLPARMRLDEMGLQQVLRHEAAHVRQRHSVDVLWVECIAAICWIVPFVHLYRRAIREVHEFEADAAVLRDTGWEPYARLLIAQHRTAGHPILAHSFHSSTLKNRIMMMHRRPSAQRAAFKYAGILPILAVVFLSFAFRDAETALTMRDMSEGGEPARSSAAAEDGGSLGYPAGDSLVRKDIAWPLFPGCTDLQGQAAMACSNEKLVAYLQAELQYPDELRRKDIQGTVIVRFVVNAAGWVINPEVVQSLAPEADAAALHVINTMNERVGQWTPGTQGGKTIDLEMAVPFRFQTSAAQQATAPGDVDQMPVYPGCSTLPAAERDACTSNRLMQFITAQLKYPEDDRKRGIEGLGIVTFVVGTDGRLRDMRLKKSVSPGIDAEILRIADELAKLPNPWTPAMRDGVPVAMEMTLPIAFKLGE